jgi:hypothetical protein
MTTPTDQRFTALRVRRDPANQEALDAGPPRAVGEVR